MDKIETLLADLEREITSLKEKHRLQLCEATEVGFDRGYDHCYDLYGCDVLVPVEDREDEDE